MFRFIWINSLYIAVIIAGFWGGIEELTYIFYAWTGVLFVAGFLVLTGAFFLDPKEHATFFESIENEWNKVNKNLRQFINIFITVLIAATGHYILAIFYLLLIALPIPLAMIRISE